MTDKPINVRLSEILTQLYEIRISVQENQGQGFLVNAEQHIRSFINFQAGLPKTLKAAPIRETQ